MTDRSGASVAFGRRELLQLGAGSAALGLILPGCPLDAAPDQSCSIQSRGTPLLPPAAWLRDARIAGIEAFSEQTACDIKPVLDRLADEHVNVVEIDPELSSYLTAEQFQKQVDLLDLMARGCHARGMRAVAYYPMLEVLSQNADVAAHTMYKDHPDWIQVSIDGKPNVFVGGSGRVFWVEAGEESAWLCPTTGFADYFAGRVVALARTALDGLWGDVPLFSDIVGVWPCLNQTCNAKFLKETGLQPPARVDWLDPIFRRWVQWRHKVIWEFEQKILQEVRKVRSDFEVIVETVTMDYNAGTVQGLDGASADDGSIYRVWEVDAVSDATGMRFATASDWISMAVMMRHGRGSSSPRPSWIFSYGLEEDDAEHVMALAIVTGNNPYETKIPVMNTSTGHEFRKRMFGWLENHNYIMSARSANTTAVLFSSASRDFLDVNVGVGLYTSFNGRDKLWWSTNPKDSAKELPYLGDYRGCCNALIHIHEPFDVVTVPHATPTMLQGYKLVVVPSAVSLPVALLNDLKAFVSAGGTLLVTGLDAGVFDVDGKAMARPMLLDALGLSDKATGWTTKKMGKGNIVHAASRAGKTYFSLQDAATRLEFEKAATLAGTLVATNAPAAVVMDLRRTAAGELLFLCANLDGLGNKGLETYSPLDASFSITLGLGGKTATRVTASTPANGAVDESISFTSAGGKVTFTVKVHTLFLARIEMA